MFGKRGRDTNTIEHLRHVKLFARCSDDELRRVARLSAPVTVPAGTAVVLEGQPGREFFVITSGIADVHVAGTRVATLGPGDFFGEMALLLLEARTATVTARTDLTVLTFDPREFETLLKDGSTVSYEMLRDVAGRLRAALPTSSTIRH